VERERITITKCVYGGEGMGKLKDGRSVFVPYVLPGEEVEIELTQTKKRFAKGMPISWISQSEKRIQAPCPYFSDCGGCHYQHLRYGEQVLLKQSIVEDQFLRLAGIDSAPIHVIELSDSELHYRNTIRLHAANDGQLGYLRYNTRELVPIEDCLLAKGNLRKFLKQFRLLPEMKINTIQFRWDTDDEVLILIDSDDIVPPEISIDFTGSIVHMSPAGEMVLAGGNSQIFEIRGIPFCVSAQSFFQANTFIAERMIEYLHRFIPKSGDGVLMDLYSGVGLFSKFFAEGFKRCVAVEESTIAIEDFVENLHDFNNVEVYEGAVEQILPALEVSPDVVIMDPPRAGVEPTVVDWLAEKEVPLVAYVSCDPSTLARDIKRMMSQGYHLHEVAMFDQFPQTYHIETISILTR
jgi:23S rRNA (uracil1939-C5)-methyltransferase